MKSLERNIKFHFEVLEKAEKLTNFIIEKLMAGESETAIDGIYTRDQLLKIVFKLVDTIEEQFSLLSYSSSEDLLVYEKWVHKVRIWAEQQGISNQEIELLLLREKEETTREIATIFDKKSRHKGYDLSTMK